MYCKCHTPHTTDFLLSSHTLSFYYICSLLILYTFSHTAQPSLHTADATLLVLNTFSTRTLDVTFLILQTVSSHHTPCLSATDVPFYSLYTLFSSCTAFSSSLRCDPLGTAHFLHSYCRCHIAETADFLLKQHTQALHGLAPKCKLINMHELINKSTNDYVTLSPCENDVNVNNKG